MRDVFGFDAQDDDPTAVLLREVLHREADAVEPSPDGLARIRTEIARQRPGPAGRLLRRWSPVLAGAAALALVASAGGLALRWRGQQQDQVQAAAGGAVVATMDLAEARTTPAASVPVYVVGRQGGRGVLFREFRPSQARDEQSMVADAVRLAVTAHPLDPDYTNLFAAPRDTKVTAQVDGAQIRIDISPAPPGARGVTAADTELVKQQLVWTATAAAAVAESTGARPTPSPSATTKQPGQRPVSITLDGRRGAWLFGLARLDHDESPGLVRQAHSAGYPDPRADVWIGDVSEGQQLARGRQRITGDAVSRADGHVRAALLLDGARVQVMTLDLDTSEESTYRDAPRPGDRGHWSVDLDLSRPGTYTLVVWSGQGPDPAAAGGGTASDAAAVPPAAAGAAVEWDSKHFVVL